MPMNIEPNYRRNVYYNVPDNKKEETPMAKIQMKTPLVEMDGDEMTRIIWQEI